MVAGVVVMVHHQSEWVRHRWVVMFALFMREVKGRGDPARRREMEKMQRRERKK